MTNFFYRNRHKFILVLFLGLLMLTLTGCRMDSGSWYNKPYTTYKAEWADLWNNGKGFWNTLWGWPINLISYPIALICSGIGKGLGNSFFWGIFFTTLIVRTLAWPIYSKTNSMSLKMQLLQPEMAKIQRKYNGRKDPQSQRAQQMETMKLYKKYKINPFGCIGTMLLQFPIFMSMYEVVQRINSTNTVVIDGAVNVTVAGKFALLNTKLFNYFEINTSFFSPTAEIKDKIFAVVVALLFGGLQILQQKLSSRPPKYQKQHPNSQNQQQQNQQKQMKTMMLVMNVMFVFMCLNSTSLAIYWLIGAIYQIFQSFVGRKINEYKYYKTQEKNNII